MTGCQPACKTDDMVLAKMKSAPVVLTKTKTDLNGALQKKVSVEKKNNNNIESN